MLSNNLQKVLTQISNAFKQSSDGVDTFLQMASVSHQTFSTRFSDEYLSLDSVDEISDAFKQSSDVDTIFR